MSYHRILVANRGEIALRVIRAAKELGYTTVAVHSTADREQLHVSAADQSVCIGPPSSAESYLNIPSILSACEITNSDAVHPGYGFLSENAQFAELCETSGITWIGPPPDSIRLMGDKIQARDKMREVGVPILPGSPGALSDADEAVTMAKEIGFPIILKAAAGGGGRGMKIVERQEDLRNAFLTCSTEAKAAFGDGSVYLERYLRKPRHVEIQVLCDTHGNGVHLHERECSVQRRHQKLMEEAPCVALNEQQRLEIGELCVQASLAIGYVGVGTFEFLADEDGSLFFMEMNTRIQVEHPVTEQITGVDLVAWQLRVAQGEKLPFTQSEVPGPLGHSMEFRINAEDPVTFGPSPGLITGYQAPGGPGVRIDGLVYSGYTVNPHYDSLVAKLIISGDDRDHCIRRARRALQEYRIEGIKTTIPFHLRLLENEEFIAADYDTNIVPRILESN
ncbi:MAG: acetyl-CoA carboxylase biotin carboxylase subunit [Myxococcota bacterium]|jgi:acetyl-CoA carboxylase biotin carboxylase subunit|nr:acetyl-CoA carboxylase biotin carboxylase subunit [Myxococcales bacterium]MBF93800.1 acetyl-CoA carboxylase biotin carboxylase subunit [Myxococcales bacterium]MEC7750920.1 acetyl-CoA carboxylase biotin carboxylase subunit [Myxococcota bacterium]